jgi:hypothetical protein
MMDCTSETIHDDQNQSYVILTIEQRMLLLPQSEVRTLESVLDIHTGQPPVHGVGWLSFEYQDWPVYGVDAALNPLSKVPDSQRICVLLTLAEGYFGLLCSDITTMHGSAVEFRPLPLAMAKPNTLLSALALFRDRIGLLSTGMSLSVYFSINVEELTTT